jgi:hypothetical protein
MVSRYAVGYLGGSSKTLENIDVMVPILKAL